MHKDLQHHQWNITKRDRLSKSNSNHSILDICFIDKDSKTKDLKSTQNYIWPLGGVL